MHYHSRISAGREYFFKDQILYRVVRKIFTEMKIFFNCPVKLYKVSQEQSILRGFYLP